MKRTSRQLPSDYRRPVYRLAWKRPVSGRNVRGHQTAAASAKPAVFNVAPAIRAHSGGAHARCRPGGGQRAIAQPVGQRAEINRYRGGGGRECGEAGRASPGHKRSPIARIQPNGLNDRSASGICRSHAWSVSRCVTSCPESGPTPHPVTLRRAHPVGRRQRR